VRGRLLRCCIVREFASTLVRALQAAPRASEVVAEAGMSQAPINFVKQQGFGDASVVTCDVQYPALMFQPRVLGVLVLAAVVLQASPLFLTLSAVLWWSALLPRLNPFDRLYNRLIAVRHGRPGLTPAPAPRRVAQGMAATFTLLIGVSLLAGWDTLAWILEALPLVALGALIFGAFCVGSYVFHLLTGNGEFAQRTLPWGRGV
jgi:hypothetical protein